MFFLCDPGILVLVGPLCVRFCVTLLCLVHATRVWLLSDACVFCVALVCLFFV